MNTATTELEQAVAHILRVPVGFFFDGAPNKANSEGQAPTPDPVSEIIATPEGLALARAFIRIKAAKLRWAIVKVVEGIAPGIEARRK